MWLDKPVAVDKNFNFTQILSNNKLLEKINNDIDKMSSKINLDYKIINWNDSTNYKKQNILDFINNNYITSNNNNYKLIYTIDLLDFYCNNAIIIEFHAKNNDRVIGYIIGKKENIQINKDIIKYIDILEVNFLCIYIKLRNIGISSYMIAILSKISISLYNIPVAHYTICTDIKSPYFCIKDFYYRPINIDKLYNVNFFNMKVNIETHKKTYNTFHHNNNIFTIKCINGNSLNEHKHPKLIDTLYLLYKDYTFKSYIICENIDINTFKKSFFNNAFTHFIIYKNDKIISYISMFKLDTLYNNKTTYSSGFLYYMFFLDNSIIESFNLISEYIYIHKLFDLITFSDIFNIDYSKIKCLQGSGLLKYYLFNISSCNIEPYKNGLITI